MAEGTSLIGKHVKAVYRDAKHTKVVHGILLDEDDFTYTIKGDRDGKTVVVGKSTLTSLTEVG